MAGINEIKTKGLEEICKDAKIVDTHRGYPILCASEKPGAGIAPQIPVGLLGKGDVCVATTFYSTGHESPDCSINHAAMYECPYRKI